MPLFDYICDEDKKQFEISVPINKVKEEIKCPICQKPLRKKINSVPFKIN